MSRGILVVLCPLSAFCFSVSFALGASKYPPIKHCPPPPTNPVPTCSYYTNANKEPEMDCTAPGQYYFEAWNGLGCAGFIEDIRLNMVRALDPNHPGQYRTQYWVYFGLYTGIGYQKDTDGFHINGLLANGGRANDFVNGDSRKSVGGIQLNLGRCYYGPPTQFKYPYQEFPSVSQFDFTDPNNKLIGIDIVVDPAINAGRGFHC